MARYKQSWLDNALHGAVTMLAGIFRLRRREFPVEVAAGVRDDGLENLSGQEFASLVAAAFRQEGYLVVERAGRRVGGAVDLEMYLGRDRYLVQCKQWQANRVDIAVVRELLAAMRAERAVGCFIVTSGSFSDDARAFATGRAIRLVPADSLRKMIAREAADDGATTSGGQPACPTCGKAMISRISGRRESAGQSFWGCSAFPACRGVRAK